MSDAICSAFLSISAPYWRLMRYNQFLLYHTIRFCHTLFFQFISFSSLASAEYHTNAVHDTARKLKQWREHRLALYYCQKQYILSSLPRGTSLYHFQESQQVSRDKSHS